MQVIGMQAKKIGGLLKRFQLTVAGLDIFRVEQNVEIGTGGQML